MQIFVHYLSNEVPLSFLSVCTINPFVQNRNSELCLNRHYRLKTAAFQANIFILMFCLFSLLSYVIVPNLPPIMLVRNSDGSEIDAQESFSSVISKIQDNANVTIIRINGSLRTQSEIQSLTSGITGFYVFRNESIKSLLSREKTYLQTNLEAIDAKTAVEESVIAGNYTFVMEDYPVYDKLITNPFTAPVWNCLILIVFLIIILSWAVYQYANIEVQTRFAKKIN